MANTRCPYCHTPFLLGITPTFLTLISLAYTDTPSTQLGLVLIMSTIRILLVYIDFLP